MFETICTLKVTVNLNTIRCDTGRVLYYQQRLKGAGLTGVDPFLPSFAPYSLSVLVELACDNFTSIAPESGPPGMTNGHFPPLRFSQTLPAALFSCAPGRTPQVQAFVFHIQVPPIRQAAGEIRVELCGGGLLIYPPVATARSSRPTRIRNATPYINISGRSSLPRVRAKTSGTASTLTIP